MSLIICPKCGHHFSITASFGTSSHEITSEYSGADITRLIVCPRCGHNISVKY